MDEDGITEAEKTLDHYENNIQPLLDGEPVREEPEECPICGAVFRGRECGGCGYKNTSEDWRG